MGEMRERKGKEGWWKRGERVDKRSLESEIRKRRQGERGIYGV
jgi:hypothetical protein